MVVDEGATATGSVFSCPSGRPGLQAAGDLLVCRQEVGPSRIVPATSPRWPNHAVRKQSTSWSRTGAPELVVRSG